MTGATRVPLPAVPPANLRAKRLLDLCLGVPALLAAAPLLAAIWAGHRASGLLRAEDGGPVFFKIYRNIAGRAALLYKVRVSRMAELDQKLGALDAATVEDLVRYLDAGQQRELGEQRHLLVEDWASRPTRFGRLVKLVYLDELPQLLNVVFGDMSLVGPRPLPLIDPRTRPGADGLVTLKGRRFDYRHRNELPGGLTGLYQTNKSARAKRDYDTFVIEGVALDREYYEFLLRARPWQVVLKDLQIIAGTFKILWEHEGV